MLDKVPITRVGLRDRAHQEQAQFQAAHAKHERLARLPIRDVARGYGEVPVSEEDHAAVPQLCRNSPSWPKLGIQTVVIKTCDFELPAVGESDAHQIGRAATSCAAGAQDDSSCLLTALARHLGHAERGRAVL